MVHVEQHRLDDPVIFFLVITHEQLVIFEAQIRQTRLRKLDIFEHQHACPRAITVYIGKCAGLDPDVFGPQHVRQYKVTC